MDSDTIYAPATAAGEGSIAILRVSGPRAKWALCKLMPGKTFLPRRLTLGRVEDANGELLDVCLGVFMPAPHTYTGEDVAELQLHGGRAPLRRAMDALQSMGLRLAQPGEFTRRAFENGKIDLSQAEAVAALIAAGGEAASKAAASQLSGGLSRRIRAYQDALTRSLAQIAAAIDYPDSVDEEKSAREVANALPALVADARALLSTYARGRAARDGVRIALLGRPNVGKSTLFNRLAGQDKAIVTRQPGTTRDVLECSLELCGLRATLLDTAGIRETCDEIERAGVRRALRAAREADVKLLLVEPHPHPEDAALLAQAGADTLLVVNKCDASVAAHGFARRPDAICISAKEGTGMDALHAALRQRLRALAPAADALTLQSARHHEALSRACDRMQAALCAAREGLPVDLLDIDLRAAHAALCEITGETATEEILDAVFSQFCLGK